MASTISAGTTAGTAVAITGDTSGNLSLLTQNGANTITVPNGSGTIAVQGVSSNIVSGTAVTASGTSIDFTSIPSWVKRVTVMFNGVSTNGSSLILVQVGAGSVTTTGYTSAGGLIFGSNATLIFNSTAGIIIYSAADATQVGTVTFNLLSSNTWVATGTLNPNSSWIYNTAGKIALGGTLDRVRITTVNGTDTFDAGNINILYE